MLALVVPAAFVPSAIASAGASPVCGTTGTLDSSSNACTYAIPGTDSYTVATGVSELTVNAFGAEGGINGEGGNGGAGGEADATISVTPGETLQITVGAQGSGNTGAGYYYNGGGGGASDVRTGSCAAILSCALTSRIIVAGGGGGAGAFNYPDPTGSVGGAGGGINGGGGTGISGEGGGGGSSSGGGSGGVGSGGLNGAAGTLGYGGAGAGTSVDEGGNGGDGYYGGGGGGGWSGAGGSGGGGSGYITPNAIVATFATGVQNGNGEVVIGELEGASTTTTLTSSSNPVSSGEAVTYSATVSPIPDAGTVSFSDGANTAIIPGCSAQSLNYATGVATCTVTYPNTTGSPHVVTAAYVGDTYYLASVSSTLSEVVGVATATATRLTSSLNPAPAGDPVTYSATVSPVPDGGTVSFDDGGVTIAGCGTESVNTTTGVATCVVTYITTSGSPHSISAVYGGDATFPSSTSSILNETVNTGPSATTVTSSTNPSGLGQQVVYSATVSPVPDAGTLDFEDGGVTIAGCGAESVSTTTGIAICAVTYTSATGSPHSITGIYSGSSNFATSTSATLSQSVSAIPPTYSTPGTYLYTVPAGVPELTINAFGAEGGINGEGGNGGAGGEADATISVTPGETFQITVGAQGSGNTGADYYYAGGGGGASDVRTGSCAATLSCVLTDRIIAAGGGGGAGAFNYPDPTGEVGGAGGGANGGAGTGLSGEGGGGATSSAGGSAGTGNEGTGGSGTLGYGGGGAGSSINQGGSGGDGYYGGGGGGGWSGIGGSGGGGSGYITPSAIVSSMATGVQSGNGEVVIDFADATPSTPSITNLPTSGLFGASFTPVVTTTGDGATAVSSNSTSVCTITSGVVNYVGVGTCSLTATLAAGADYVGATGVAQTFAVTAANPSAPRINNVPTSAVFGASFTPVVTTTGDGATSVVSNSTSVCTITSGVVNYVGVGTCSLTSSVAAGADYAGATGVAQTFGVTAAPSSTPSITNIPTNALFGESFSPVVTTTGDGATSVVSNTTSVCTVENHVVMYVGVGSCSLTASVAAGADYASATGVAQRFSILVVTFMDMQCSGGYDIVNQAVTCTVSLNNGIDTGITAPATGVLTWTILSGSGSFSASSCTLSSSTCSVTYTPALGSEGSQTVLASYAGDADHTEAAGQTSLTATPRSSSVAVQCANGTDVVNESVTCTATVSDTSTGVTAPPTGDVDWTITSGSGSLSALSCTLSSSTCSVTYTPALGSEGSQTLNAAYSGDVDHTASSTDATLSTTTRASSVVVQCGNGADAVNETVTCTATVTDTATGVTAPPTGVVDWILTSGSGSFSALSCTLASSTCSVTYTPALGTEGAQTLEADYEGDVDHSGSSDVATLNATTRSSSIAVQCLQTNVAVGVGTTCTATVTDTGAGVSVQPMGTMSWLVSVGSATLTPTCTLSDGTCSVTDIPLSGSEGPQVLVVNYNADLDHASATLDVSLSATQASQSISFTSVAPTSAHVGGPSYAVVASGGGSGSPVIFTSLTTSVCAVTGATVTFLHVGTCTIVANQAGDIDYVVATQVQQSFTVGPAPIIAPPAAPIPPGVPTAALGTPTSVTASTTMPVTTTQSSNGTSTTLTIPAGALPSDTLVSVYPVTNATELQSLTPPGSSYVASVTVAWVTPSSTSPNSTVPLSLTITNASIVAGDTVYEVTATGLKAVGVATVNGSVTITMSSDPTFLVAAPMTPQAALHVVSARGVAGAKLSLSTSGGSGSGVLVFVATDGTAKGCVVTGDALTASSAGTCNVVATKAASAQYETMTSSTASITFVTKVAVSSKSVILHYGNRSTVMGSTLRAAAVVFSRQLVRGDVVTVRENDKGDVKIATIRLNALVALLRKSFGGVIHVQLNATSATSLNSAEIIAT